QVESLREVEIRSRFTGAEGHVRAEPDIPRQTENARGVEPIRLRSQTWMLRVEGSRREIEAEQVIAVLFRLGMGVGEVRPPPAAGVRAVERDALRVVPEALSHGIVEDERAESRRELTAAGAGRGDVRDSALGRHPVVA